MPPQVELDSILLVRTYKGGWNEVPLTRGSCFDSGDFVIRPELDGPASPHGKWWITNPCKRLLHRGLNPQTYEILKELVGLWIALLLRNSSGKAMRHGHALLTACVGCGTFSTYPACCNIYECVCAVKQEASVVSGWCAHGWAFNHMHHTLRVTRWKQDVSQR